MRGRITSALAMLGLCAPAYAATDQDSFLVTATVIASCDVIANDLAFGSYDPVLATPTDATSTILVTCTNGTHYDVGIDEGAGSGATVAARKMTASSNTLTYSLYRDASHSLVWGKTINTDTLSGTGSGAQQTLTMYGRVSAQQTAPVGSYSDTVTVTVTY